ncbi:SDR family NAD(P)-dependent oxidoreductase [Dactylosporangium sp. CS-047395]|uniref:SDR family NAD(P)-dependent oxidoreductase n=1 Tax=Dactylosporangium sp. CS-047395 TaxID=3239936 RepID=UPI003D8B1B75
MPTIALVAAGDRLGRSLARTFGRNGYDVALIARSKERLDALAGELAAERMTAAAFAADVTDRPGLTAALDRAAARFGGIDVLHYAAPAAGSGAAAHRTGALDVTVDAVGPQLETICFGAIAATHAVLPGMLAAGTGTLLYTTGASSLAPVPVFVSTGMAGAALRKWVLTLHDALAGRGIYAGHVAIGAWIAGTPGAPDGAVLRHPDDLARRYWELHVNRGPAEDVIAA